MLSHAHASCSSTGKVAQPGQVKNVGETSANDAKCNRREVQLLDLVGRWGLPLRDAVEAVGARFRRKPPGPHRGAEEEEERPLCSQRVVD